MTKMNEETNERASSEKKDTGINQRLEDERKFDGVARVTTVTRVARRERVDRQVHLEVIREHGNVGSSKL
jgi:hypothetical protein